MVIFLSIIALLSIASEDPDMDVADPFSVRSEDVQGEFYARFGYRHDFLSGRDIFVEVKVHPADAPFPGVVGGHVETNIHCVVRIRGISVPSACHAAELRARPHADIERERARWSEMMDYTWKISSPHKLLRLSNVAVDSGRIFCDAEFYLGGAWHDYATALIQDGHAYPILSNHLWDWGDRIVRAVPVPVEE